MPMSKADFLIQPFQAEDLAAVVRIEQGCYPFPWSAEHFLQEVANPFATLDLLRIGNDLAGYHCYWLIAGEMQILNLATAPGFRNRGVAAGLLQHAFSTGLVKALETAWLEVRRSNAPAIALYRRFGFQEAGVRHGYYQDGEDAMLMRRDFLSGSQ